MSEAGAGAGHALRRDPHEGEASRLDPRRALRAALASGLPYALLRARAQHGDPVTLLCYHTLGPDAQDFDAWTVLRLDDFRRQMDFVRAQYDIVSLDAALEAGPGRRGRPRAVITFDDGEAGLYSHLLPFVEAARLPVTVYVATRQIETGAPYWFDTVMNALQAPGPFTIDLGPAGLPARSKGSGAPAKTSSLRWTVGPATGPARWKVISDILETLKSLPPEIRAERAAAVVAQAPSAPARFTPLAPMSIPELAALARSDWITIGAHSHCHGLLDQIPAAEARASVARSRALLEAWTGRTVRHFAYPNGNHDASVARAVAGLGFVSATALGMTLWRRGAGPFALPRLAIGRYDDLARFKLRLAEI